MTAWATPYESARSCTGSARQGARALLAWALEAYRSADVHSLGIYNCRTVVGGSSTSLHGEGRAVDLGLPVVAGRGNPVGHAIVEQLGANGARLGIQAIVFDRQVWSAKSPLGRRYDGAHPHYDHLHIELTRQASDLLTLTTFRHVLGGAASPLDQEDIMRQGDNGPRVAAWQHRIDQLPDIDCTVDGDFGPKTVEATKAAQKLLGLGEDGEVYAAEWALLQESFRGRDLTRHAETPHGGDADLSAYAKKRHRHEGTVTVE